MLVELWKIKSFGLETDLVKAKLLGSGWWWIGLCCSVEAMEMLSMFGLDLSWKNNNYGYTNNDIIILLNYSTSIYIYC